MRLNQLAIVAFGFFVACDGIERGIKEVARPGQSSAYFKREVRGQNFDETGISLDGHRCRPLDPSADYVFAALGPITVFCDSRPGKLVVYTTSPLRAPTREIKGLVVETVVITPLAF